MQFRIEHKGNRKPVDFYFPDDSPYKAWQAYQADKTKNVFNGHVGEHGRYIDFYEVVDLTMTPTVVAQSGSMKLPAGLLPPGYDY